MKRLLVVALKDTARHAYSLALLLSQVSNTLDRTWRTHVYDLGPVTVGTTTNTTILDLSEWQEEPDAT